MCGWSSDSTVMLLPTGNSLLGKGAHPTLVSKLFLVLRGNLPSCHPTHRPGPLPQSHPTRLHSLPHNHPSYTWQWDMCSLGFVIPRRTSSVASSVLKASWYPSQFRFPLLTSISVSICDTPDERQNTSEPALQGFLELNLQEITWCDFVTVGKVSPSFFSVLTFYL